MRVFFNRTLLLAVAQFCCGCALAQVPIVRDGKSAATIVIAKNSDVEIEIAVSELKDFVKRSTGAELPVKTENDAVEGNVILLGASGATRALGIDETKLPPEGFVIKTFPGKVAIVGNREKRLNEKVTQKVYGTLWGVYRFLEDEVGCRFYFPGLGTIVPEKKDLATSLNIEDAPKFPIRQVHPPRHSWDEKMAERLAIGPEYDRQDLDIMAGRAKNTAGCKNYFRYRFANAHGNVFPNHSTSHWGDLYHKTHPEYFAMRDDGSRYMLPPDPKSKGYRTKHWHCYLDYSSEAALKQMIDDHVAWYEKKEPEKIKVWQSVHKSRCPNDFYIPLTPNDGLFLSRSPRAKELIALGTEEHWGRASEYVEWFRRNFAQAMHEKYPHLQVWALAYSSYTYPPTTIKDYPPNYHVMLAVMPGLGNLKQRDQMEHWLGVARRWHALTRTPLHYWQYSCWPAVPDPVFSAPSIQQWYRELGAISLGMFLNGPRAIKGVIGHDHLNHYLAARLMWNPDLDIDAELEDYCVNMYEAAAPEMHDFFKTVQRRWNDVQWDIPLFQKIPGAEQMYGENGTYPPEVTAQLAACIDKALAVTGLSENARRRVEWIRDDYADWFRLAKQMHTGSNPYYYAFRVSAAPEIDGRIDGDKGWSGIPDIVIDRYMESGKPTRVKSFLKVAWDDEYLYLGANHMEPEPDKIVVKWNDGEGVWSDDAVDFFLDPAASRVDNHHFMVNAAGKKTVVRTHEGLADRNKPYPGMKIATATGKDRWVFEMRIPMSALEVKPAEMHRWIWNFYRNRCVDGDGFMALEPTHHAQTANFAVFPDLILLPRPKRIESFDVDQNEKTFAIPTWNRKKRAAEKIANGGKCKVADGSAVFTIPRDAVPAEKIGDYLKYTFATGHASFRDAPVELTENTTVDIRYLMPEGIEYKAYMTGTVVKAAGGNAALRKEVFKGVSNGKWQNVLLRPVGTLVNNKHKDSYQPGPGDRLAGVGLTVEIDPGVEVTVLVDYVMVAEKTALDIKR